MQVLLDVDSARVRGVGVDEFIRAVLTNKCFSVKLGFSAYRTGH